MALLRTQADLTDEQAIADRNARRRAVYDELRETAAASQPSLLDFLQKREVLGQVSAIQPLWIVNAVAFTADPAVADLVADRPDVLEVGENLSAFTPAPQPAATEPKVGTVEWNVDRIKAPQVWDDGITGAGTVVATIDTGADHTHAALAGTYRGICAPPSTAGHACSWFDAVAGGTAPYDDHGHGTHVLGTMVGGDGRGAGTEDIGVAPGARWITAKAFNDAGIGLLTDLIEAFQWVMAPNGDPTLAPDVVNGSWTFGKCVVPVGFGPAGSPAFILSSLRASGILPVFAIGNLGPYPATAESPGDLENAFGIGATHSNADDITSFSGRGPACHPGLGVKPDVVSPGLNIRSALAGGGYGVKSGTSMAAPHAAATAALVVQAAGGPGAIAVDDVEAFVRNTARDLGPLGADHTFGHGIVDAAAAVDAAAKTGVLTGQVTATGCRPTAGALVRLESVSDPRDVRQVAADSLGVYRFRHLDGSYVVRVEDAFGYVTPSGAVTVTVPNGATVTQNLIPTPLPCGTITGTVTQVESGEAVAGLSVEVEDTPIAPVTTDATGSYTIPNVPDGTYVVHALADNCIDIGTARKPATMNAGVTPVVTTNFDLAVRRDAAGYWCAIVPGGFVRGTDIIDLGGDDRSTRVNLPFLFSFYGASYDRVHVSTNGFLRFDSGSSEWANGGIPSSAAPNLAAYALWDDLVATDRSLVLTRTLPDAFVIEWRDVTFRHSPDDTITFEAILHRNGDLEFQYLTGTGVPATGGSATVGIENGAGTVGLQYSRDEAGAVPLGRGIVFHTATTPGLLRGVVTDGANPIAGARVAATSGGVTRAARTDANGAYRLWLQAGSYTLEASAFGYAPATGTATITANATVVQSFALSALPTHVLSGTVTETGTGQPIEGVIVQVDVPEVPRVRTDAAGQYSMTLPEGTYVVTAAPSSRCQGRRTATVSLTAATTQNFDTTVKRDSFGYTCVEQDVAPIAWSSESNTGLRGDDQAKRIELPFEFPFYGGRYSTAHVSTNGMIRFGSSTTEPRNDQVPTLANPNLALYPFWDDLFIDGESRVYTKRVDVGSSTQAFAFEWRNANFRNQAWARTTFQLILYPGGDIAFEYFSGAGDVVRGSGATIGIENVDGTTALAYAYNERAVEPGLRVVMHPERHPVTGVVTDAATSDPVEDATVTAVGTGTHSVTTDENGEYTLLLPEGVYDVTASMFGYVPSTATGVSVTAPVAQSFALAMSPVYTISGQVTDVADSQPMEGVKVRFSDPDIPEAVTDTAGTYTAEVPVGTYTITAGGRCRGSVSATVTVTASNVTQDFQIPVLKDSSYVCRDDEEPFGLPIVVPALTTLNPATFDDRWVPLALPFDFPIYNQTSRTAFISTNGFIRFDLPSSVLTSETPPPATHPCHAAKSCIPSPADPNMAVYPFWDDLVVDQATAIRVGFRTEDTLVVVWEFARFKGDSTGNDPSRRVTVQTLIHKSGDVEFQYILVPSPLPTGASPVVGIEKAAGLKGLQYPRPITPGLRIRFDFQQPS